MAGVSKTPGNDGVCKTPDNGWGLQNPR